MDSNQGSAVYKTAALTAEPSPHVKFLGDLLNHIILPRGILNAFLGLVWEQVDEAEFYIGACPLFRMVGVRPDVRQFMQRGVKVLRAQINNLVVQIRLAHVVVVFPRPSWRDVMMELKFGNANFLLLRHGVDEPNDGVPAQLLPVLHFRRKENFKVKRLVPQGYSPWSALEEPPVGYLSSAAFDISLKSNSKFISPVCTVLAVIFM